MAHEARSIVPAATDTAGLLALAENLGRTVLAPNALASDEGREPPRADFAALAAAGFLGLSIAPASGGLGADSVAILQVYEALARYSAVTPFLLNQHVGVCGAIAAGNPALAARTLPLLARGELIAAVGASQLRRAGTPMLRAARVEGGYTLQGTVPWASGLGLMTHVLLGAVADDDRALFFWLPFAPATGMRFGPLQDLAVMRATCTVSVICEELFVPDASLVGDDRTGYWRVQHGGALTNPVSYLLGIGAACLDGLRAASARTGTLPAPEQVETLACALAEEREGYYGLQRRGGRGAVDQEVLDALLAARVRITDLVLRLATLAIAAEGGTAHLRANAAQRHLREASFFLTATVNRSTREALLAGL